MTACPPPPPPPPPRRPRARRRGTPGSGTRALTRGTHPPPLGSALRTALRIDTQLPRRFRTGTGTQQQRQTLVILQRGLASLSPTRATPLLGRRLRIPAMPRQVSALVLPLFSVIFFRRLGTLIRIFSSDTEFVADLSVSSSPCHLFARQT